MFLGNVFICICPIDKSGGLEIQGGRGGMREYDREGPKMKIDHVSRCVKLTLLRRAEFSQNFDECDGYNFW